MALGLLASCAYLNTLYNAERAYEEGVRIRAGADSLPAPAREQFDKAIEKSAVVLSRHPDSRYADDALLLLARSFAQIERHDDAARTYRRFLTRFPDADAAPRARLELARVERLRGEHPSARATLDALLDSEAEGDLRAEVLYERALLALETDDYETATSVFRTLLDERPEWARDHQVAVRFADAEVVAGRWREALEVYRSYTEESSDPRVRRESGLRISRALVGLGRHDEAIETLEGLLSSSLPDSVEAVIQVERGASLEAKGAWSEAEDAYRVVAELAPGTPVGSRATYRRGQIAWHVRDDREEAQQILLDAFIHSPSSVWGDSARSEARRLERLIHYARVVQGELSVPGIDDPDLTRATALFRLAEETLEAEDDPGRALEIYRRIAREHPDSPWAPRARLAVGLLEREIGDEASATRTLRALVAEHPEHPASDSARELLGLPLPDRSDDFYATPRRLVALVSALPGPEDPIVRIVDEMGRYAKRREAADRDIAPGSGRDVIRGGRRLGGERPDPGAGPGDESGQEPGLGPEGAEEGEREPGIPDRIREP